MDRVEERAAQALARVPEWLWDGESLPVPIEDIADSVYGLLIRDVEDMTAAPGAPALAPGQSLSGLLLAARGEIWVNRRRGAHVAHTAPLHDRARARAWELHRDAQRTLFCRSTTVKEDQRATVPDMEEEASRFAAALLMPQWLMVRATASTARSSMRCAGRSGRRAWRCGGGWTTSSSGTPRARRPHLREASDAPSRKPLTVAAHPSS